MVSIPDIIGLVDILIPPNGELKKGPAKTVLLHLNRI